MERHDFQFQCVLFEHKIFIYMIIFMSKSYHLKDNLRRVCQGQLCIDGTCMDGMDAIKVKIQLLLVSCWYYSSELFYCRECKKQSNAI